MDSLCGKECFSYKAERLFLLASAMVSSKEAKQIAPLKPSSSLADTLAARFSRASWGTLLVIIPGALWGRSESASSLVIELTQDAKLLQWPPLLGTLGQRGAKQNRCSQDDSLIFDVTWSRIAASFLEDGWQEARGSLFRIFTVEHRGSNKGHGKGSAVLTILI